MHGRTKSFFEDSVIIIIVIVLLYGIYSFFDSFTQEDKNNPIKIEKATPQEETVKSTILEKQVKEEQAEDKVIIQVPQLSKVEEDKKKVVVEKKEKNVDLRMLRAFLIETKMKIRNNIVVPSFNSDLNTTNEDNFLSFRLTILKDGSYEQLTYVSGNKKLFEMNKENITKMFPLSIDNRIKDDFPRYFRVKLENKE